MPILPPATFASAYGFLGTDAGAQMEQHRGAPLPQWLADRCGWVSLSHRVAGAVGQLPRQERSPPASSPPTTVRRRPWTGSGSRRASPPGHQRQQQLLLLGPRALQRTLGDHRRGAADPGLARALPQSGCSAAPAAPTACRLRMVCRSCSLVTPSTPSPSSGRPSRISAEGGEPLRPILAREDPRPPRPLASSSQQARRHAPDRTSTGASDGTVPAVCRPSRSHGGDA